MKFKSRIKDAKISQKGQITVPKEVRDQLGVEAGDRILFFFDENEEIKITNTENAKVITKNNKQVGNVKKVGSKNAKK